jgi:hypothetical protein
VNLGKDWNIFDVLPEDKGFYTYQGSIIREPCTENVTWVVMANPVYASIKFFDKMKQLFPNESNRGARNDDAREVLYNPNTDRANKENYGSSMRCYDDMAFRSQCSLLSQNALIKEQKDDSLMYIILFILGVIVIVLLILIREKVNLMEKMRNIGNRLSSSLQSK